jgi:predicted transcriptional regulator
MTATLTTRFDDATMSALDRLAVQAWQLDKITEGVAAADRGDFVDRAEIDRIAGKYDLPA